MLLGALKAMDRNKDNDFQEKYVTTTILSAANFFFKHGEEWFIR